MKEGDTMKYRLTDEQMKTIMMILNSGQRVELIPLKNNVKIFEITRKEHK